MLVPVRNVAAVGIVADLPDYELPPNAWTGGRNVRFLDGSVQKARGHSNVFTPAITPYGLFAAPTSDNLYWVYTGLSKVHAYSNGLDADITRASGDYTATATDQWHGGTFNGIFYLNNGKDDPQVWNPQSLSTKLVDLPNWPANTKAKVLRHFKNFLVAMDISSSGTRYPRKIKWSHSASPGTVPSSWDHTDPTLDAGEFTLAEGFDTIIDGVPLGDLFAVYTENETWIMRYVGGQYVFAVSRLFPGLGLLAQGCVAPFVEKYVGRHFVVTQDDIVVHDGANVNTQIDRRLRKWFFTRLTSPAFYTTLVVPHYKDREMWVCFNQGGGASLNTALIWNWRDDTWAVRDLPDIRAAAIIPQALVGSGLTWEGLSGTWDSPVGYGSEWSDPERSPYSQAILMASPVASSVVKVDDSTLFGTEAYETYIEHTGIVAVAQSNDGRIIGDPNRQKMLLAVWPHISAESGTVINISVGARDGLAGAPSWLSPKPFVVGSDVKSDQYVVGRVLAVRFSSNSPFKLEGYDLDIVPLGML